MTNTNVRDVILRNLNLRPTQDQFRFIKAFSDFIEDNGYNKTFILRGYAGTGKTTLVNVLVKSMPQLKLKSVLLAPTGRAAKVLSLYTGKRATTIHKRIYQTVDHGGGSVGFKLASNKSSNTIFFVDEASMIGGNSQRSDGQYQHMNLLEDLIAYVFDGENCSLVFIGDVAQLPPINEKVSPSLSKVLLRQQCGLEAQMIEIRQVLRQASDSGILFNATQLRNQLFEQQHTPQFQLSGFNDIYAIQGNELSDYIEDAYGRSGMDETLLLCRSNKQANGYNQQIRHRILYREHELEGGDLLMVVKNNYFWLDKDSKAGFIANGDALEVLSVGKKEEKFGFQFIDCEVRMIDYPNEKNINIKVMLNALDVDGPSISYQQYDQLYNELVMHYGQTIGNKKVIHFKIKEDPYYNALQVKYAYAVTCHKAQGGQWKEIFIDQGYLTAEHLNAEYLRWLYTAMTRATERVYLLNFSPNFFEED